MDGTNTKLPTCLVEVVIGRKDSFASNASFPLPDRRIRGPSDHVDRQAERMSGFGSGIKPAERLRWTRSGTGVHGR